MEPRMRPRPRGPQFPSDDIAAMLTAFGDVSSSSSSSASRTSTSHAPHGSPSGGAGPLPSTILALDAIITDFVIETCHEAGAHASHAGRAKVKQDDFQHALRRDARKLGRVLELLELDRDMKRKRRMVEMDEGVVLRRQAAAEAAALLEGGGGAAGAGPGAAGTTGRGRGRRRARREGDAADAKSEAGRSAKGRKRAKLEAELQLHHQPAEAVRLSIERGAGAAAEEGERGARERDTAERLDDEDGVGAELDELFGE